MKDLIAQLEAVVNSLKNIPPVDSTPHELVLEYTKHLNSGDVQALTQTVKKMRDYSSK